VPEQPVPGSQGEHLLQESQGSQSRASAFYHKQLLHHLNPFMRRFIAAQGMVFIGTADSKGECDCSFRAGPRGFIRVLDDRSLVFPDYRGNGVFSSMGNILENPHIGMLFIDFFRAAIGLHVNGTARILSHLQLPLVCPLSPNFEQPVELVQGKPPELWISVLVEEAYVHCSKHIPLLAKAKKEIDWGSDDQRLKKGDYFHPQSCFATNTPASASQ
jgi:predicted pyridoxine 5'-phosphate oxidase superfamily flavin-nucleotide-binding protein